MDRDLRGGKEGRGLRSVAFPVSSAPLTLGLSLAAVILRSLFL